MLRSTLKNQQGLAIVWIASTIFLFAVLGMAMVSSYNISTLSLVDTSLSLKSKITAESGYRFLRSEYENKSGDDNKNRVIEELNGKTFNVAPDGNGQFQSDVTSYFYRIRTDPGGGSSLALKFIGNAGFNVPNSGFFKIGTKETVYEYTNPPATSSDTDGSTIYTFSVTPNVPSTPVYTTVRPVVNTSFGAVNEGGNLTLGSGLGSIFPSESGVFLISKNKIKANLPVKTIVPYRYKYRNVDQLVNITAGPDQSSFTTIDAGNPDFIEMAKFINTDSTGFVPEKANAVASETKNYKVALDVSNFTPGLVSYFSFDNSAEPAKDDYGTSHGSLEGGTPPTWTGGGKVGGALEFSGSGYVSTQFNPRKRLGNNQYFTLNFWAKPGDNIINPQIVIGSWDTLSVPLQYFFFGVYRSQWVWGYGNQYSTTDLSLPDAVANQWQHVSFVYYYDEGDFKKYVVIYINGLEKYRTEYTGNGLLPDLYADIGALYDQSDRHRYNFIGTIDELAIFNRPLDICEVREIYNVPCNVGCGIFNTANDPGFEPVAYYPFNGNADDESGVNKDGNPPNDNPGQERNGVALATDQYVCIDKAYSFDGNNDYIDCGNKSDLNIGNEITVMAWVNHTSGDGHIVNRGGGWDDSGYSLFWYTGNIRVELQNSVDKQILDTPAPSNGTWHHIAFTWNYNNSKQIVTYIDGDPVATYIAPYNNQTFTGPIGIPSQNLNIGRNQRHAYYFNGKIDEVVIWNKALSPPRISDYYNLTKQP